MKAPPLTYQESLNYLYSLRRFGIKPGLERIERLLSLLSNPHKGFNSVLVGGTNGKGSVCAMLSSILSKAGYKTGLYTSPHLQRFTERIKIDGREIPEEKVVELVERIRSSGQWSVVRTHHSPSLLPTFFEFVTAMAFLYFFEESIDVGVIEVGMGGRLDATNVLNPNVSVITNVSLEHERFLGRRIAEIAKEKGGIIKERGFVVTGVCGKALQVLRAICNDKKADLKVMGRDFYVEEREGGGFDYYGKERHSGLKASLVGKHQIYNAALVISALELLKEKGFVVSEEFLRRGLEEASWPGRLELVEFKDKRILLDSAHNPAGIRVLREFLSKKVSFKRLYLVIGIMQDKAVGRMLRGIIPIANEVILTQPREVRATPIEVLVRMAKRYSNNAYGIKNVAEAVRHSIKLIDSEDLLCITGSIFTVAETKEEFERLFLPKNKT